MMANDAFLLMWLGINAWPTLLSTDSPASHTNRNFDMQAIVVIMKILKRKLARLVLIHLGQNPNKL